MFNEDKDYLDKISEESWLDDSEGQLSVDVIESAHDILIRSAIAGVEEEDLDISLTPDSITIRGKRSHGCDEWEEGVTHIEECFWGSFSRSVVLPHHVKPDSAEALLKNGILTIRLEKAEMNNRIDIQSQ